MSTIDETQLLEDTIDFDAVTADDESIVGADDSSIDNTFPIDRVQAGSAFQEQIQLQEKSIAQIQDVLEQIQKKNVVIFYFGILGVVFLIAGISVLFFMSQSKASTMFFLGLVAGLVALGTMLVLILEGYKFLQIRRHMNYVSTVVLKDNAMNTEEKKQGLQAFVKLKELLNGVTFLTSLIGNDIQIAALEFQTLRCISDSDKARILELRDHEFAVVENVNKELDQHKRLEEEIVNVTMSQQTYMKELEAINEAVRSIPSLKNDFGISHDRYNNLGGETAEQALEHEWKTRIDEITATLHTAEGEKERVSEHLESLKKEAEQKYNEAKKVKTEKKKKKNQLEKDKQALLKKIEHAHSDFESASKNIIETNERMREIDAKLLTVTTEEERNHLNADHRRLEDQMKKHMSVSEKAKNFIDTSNSTEFDLYIATVQSELLKCTQETEEMIHFYEGEVNKLQNELNRKMREVMQSEETLKLRQSQRQAALMPFQEQVEIMLGLDKKIRAIMQKEREEKPSLEAKIAGVTQRIDNLTVEKNALEIKVRDDKERLALIEAEIQNLSNNFIN